MRKRKPTRIYNEVSLMGNKLEWNRLGKSINDMVHREGIARLVRIRDAISKDANLPMPPIRIEPYGWESPGRDGPIYGACSPIADKINIRWGVKIPVSNLVVINNDSILRRVLCHEFAHCFYMIIQTIQKPQSCDSQEESSNFDAFERQLLKDSEELIEPGDWFGEWDAEHFTPESGDDPMLKGITIKFQEHWRNKGLPIKELDMRFEADGTLLVPDEIIEHIRKLGIKID